MTRFTTITLVVGLAGPLVLGWWSGTRWYRAEQTVRNRTSQYEQTAADVGEMLALQARIPRVSLQERPAQDVIAHVNDVLGAIGLPASRLKRLTAESDVQLSRGPGQQGPEYRRQSVRLILQAMTVSDLGFFLVEWRTEHPVWTPARIELALPAGRRTRSGRYDVTIILSAAYVAGGERS